MKKVIIIFCCILLNACESAKTLAPNHIVAGGNYTLNASDRIIDLRNTKINVGGDLRICSDEQVLMPASYHIGGKLHIGKGNECLRKK